MAARSRRQNHDDKQGKPHKPDKRLHPKSLHLAPRPDAKALGDPEPLHPEPLHLDHVGDDEQEEVD